MHEQNYWALEMIAKRVCELKSHLVDCLHKNRVRGKFALEAII